MNKYTIIPKMFKQGVESIHFYKDNQIACTIYKGNKHPFGHDLTDPRYTIKLNNVDSSTSVLLHDLDEAIDTCYSHVENFDDVQEIAEIKAKAINEFYKDSDLLE